MDEVSSDTSKSQV